MPNTNISRRAALTRCFEALRLTPAIIRELAHEGRALRALHHDVGRPMSAVDMRFWLAGEVVTDNMKTGAIGEPFRAVLVGMFPAHTAVINTAFATLEL